MSRVTAAAAERVSPVVAHHGEGPVWHDGALHLVDMNAGDVVTLRRGDGRRDDPVRVHLDERVSALRPRVGGGWVYALDRRFGLGRRNDHRGVERLDPIALGAGIRFNDGACDPFGRFLCGTVSDDGSSTAALWRLDRTLRAEPVLDGVAESNGLDFSPDGSLAYYVDSPTGRIDRFAQTDAGLSGRRRFVTIDGGDPDGLTVDAAGGVWVAVWGAGEVRRFDADATLTDIVSVPVSQPSACTFGGDDLSTLFITTSREDLADGAEPDAGAVFAIRPAVGGRPTLPFAG